VSNKSQDWIVIADQNSIEPSVSRISLARGKVLEVSQYSETYYVQTSSGVVEKTQVQASELSAIRSGRTQPGCLELIYFDNLLVRPEVSSLWTFQRRPAILFAMTKGKGDINKKSEVLQGTLDLMILKTLQAMGPLHGFGIARRLEQLSEEVLRLNEGTVYTSLLRLQQEGWIAAEWGASENNRKAKFYSITKRGLKQLARETEDWERISGVIDRLLRLEGQRS
jgi:PadR family transcriptional regulator PadR